MEPRKPQRLIKGLTYDIVVTQDDILDDWALTGKSLFGTLEELIGRFTRTLRRIGESKLGSRMLDIQGEAA